jgi:heme/copper-type cytochrome/quinol oxidase subunit 2
VYARAGFFDRTLSLQIALGLALAVSILVLVAAWRGRNRKLRDHKHRDSPAARRSLLWLRAAAASWLVFIAIFAYAVIKIVGDTTEAFYRFPGLWLTIALWLSPLAILMSLICVLRLPAVWGAREWKWGRKIRYTVVVATYLFACWTLWVWNAVIWKL